MTVLGIFLLDGYWDFPIWTTVGKRGHGGHGHSGPGPDGGRGVALVADPGQDPEVAGGGRGGGEHPGDHGDVHDKEQPPSNQVILPARHQAVSARKISYLKICIYTTLCDKPNVELESCPWS